jgi:hypothetical protein
LNSCRFSITVGVERRLGDGALLIAFLVKVSTKFDLIGAHATEDQVARRQCEGLRGEGGAVQAGVEVVRSTFRCSMVVVVFMEMWCGRREMGRRIWPVPDLSYADSV